MNENTNNDLVLKTAKKRVGFKKHLTYYILINLMLWIIFFIPLDHQTLLYVFLFVLLIWTIVIVGHYFFAIRWNKKMLEKEVKKLMKEQVDINQEIEV
ncbi:MAG: 2TM domain-containing protein [Bacteroidales bacterium]|jgi:hypothetical protein|nr:2TM domain-containing protein [Bacteroidales bacterium]